MPDLIDSMVMKITLDPANFRAGELEVAKLQKLLRDDATKTATSMEASGKQAAMFFADAKREALGLLGTLVGAGGLAAFAAKSTTSLATLGREARNIGVTVRELSAFQNVVERNGGSAESATQSFKGFVDQMERLKTFGDNPQFQSYLSQIGADRADNPMTAFLKFMRFVQEHKNDVPLIRLIGRGLGFDEGLVNTAIQIGSVTEATKQLANEMQRVATPEQVAAARAVQEAWFDLEHQAENTGRQIYTNLSPAMLAVLHTGEEILKQNPQLTTAITALVGGLVVLSGLRISASLLGLTGLSAAVGMTVARLERLLPLLALLGFTGPAGGTDDEFSKRKNDEYLRNNPAGSRPISDWIRRQLGMDGGASGSAPPAAGNAAEVAQRTHDFWRSKGYTEEQVAGILAGGPGAESGFNPAAVGDNGTSYGLYQHHAERWEAMQRRYGTKYPTEAQQNEYAAWEISEQGPLSDVGRRLRSARNAQDAAMIWTGGFEKPADPAAGMKRGRNAARYIGLYDANPSKMPPAVDPSLRLSPSGAVTTTNSSTSNSSSVQIGDVHVHTQATDAGGVARDLRKHIDDVMGSGFVPQANRGLQ